MSDKLTPRVGDRVLVRTTAFSSDARKRTYVGKVSTRDETDVLVVIDEVNGSGWWPKDSVTVVDREPVEWPEGWERSGSYAVTWLHGSKPIALSHAELLRLQREIPDMLARWDELMGGDA